MNQRSKPQNFLCEKWLARYFASPDDKATIIRSFDFQNTEDMLKANKWFESEHFY